MTEKTYQTPCGKIHYWINSIDNNRASLVFLPGLTANHKLFEKQTEYFKDKYNIFVWDAPGHSASWPFDLTFELKDMALWLDEILHIENIHNPIFIGQSMGGCISQVYAQLFPYKMSGFISIDSFSLKRKYFSKSDIWFLERLEPTFKAIPWKSLLNIAKTGLAESQYGQELMYNITMDYDGDKKRYAKLAGHGYKIIAGAVKENLPYDIKCPTLLICGDKDRAGFCLKFNKQWHENTGIPIEWINGAGHNSNTDNPELTNRLIEDFVENTVN